MRSPVLSESEALRTLDLPSSRRDWLRRQASHGLAGKVVVYRAADILKLRDRLQAEGHRDALPMQTRDL